MDMCKMLGTFAGKVDLMIGQSMSLQAQTGDIAKLTGASILAFTIREIIMSSHCDKILGYLRYANGGITSWEAIQRFGCTRLAARISDLKDKGYRIDTQMEQSDDGGTRFARYFLIGESKI